MYDLTTIIDELDDQMITLKESVSRLLTDYSLLEEDNERYVEEYLPFSDIYELKVSVLRKLEKIDTSNLAIDDELLFEDVLTDLNGFIYDEQAFYKKMKKTRDIAEIASVRMDL